MTTSESSLLLLPIVQASQSCIMKVTYPSNLQTAGYVKFKVINSTKPIAASTLMRHVHALWRWPVNQICKMQVTRNRDYKFHIGCRSLLNKPDRNLPCVTVIYKVLGVGNRIGIGELLQYIDNGASCFAQHRWNVQQVPPATYTPVPTHILTRIRNRTLQTQKPHQHHQNKIQEKSELNPYSCILLSR